MKTELAKASNKGLAANGANGSSLSFNAGVEFTLLDKSLTAIVVKSGKKVQFVLQPTPGSKDTSFSISQVCSEITRIVSNLTGSNDGTPSPDTTVDAGSVVEKMKGYVPGATDDYMVKLNEIFLYICKDSSVTPPKTTFEYAFSISIDKKEDADIGLSIVSLDSIYVNIWNTERANILKKMSMGDIEALLNS